MFKTIFDRSRLSRSKAIFLVTLMGIVAGCNSSSTPAPASVQSIQVSAKNAQAALGTSATLSATVLYSDGTHQDVTSQAAWSSSSAAIVATSATTPGTVTSLSVGTATISAAFHGTSGSMQFVATPAVLASLQLTPAMASLANGMGVQMIAIGTFSDNTTQNLTSQVSWSTANSAVATISNVAGSTGIASAASVGSTTISATSSAVSAMTRLTVTAATLSAIQVNPSNVVLAPGTSQALTATGIFSDGSKQDLTTQATWSSSSPAAATFSTVAGSTGLVTAVAAGASKLTATVGSVSGSSIGSVTSATLVSIAITPAAPSIALGTTQQFIATGTYSDHSTQNVTSAVTWTSGTSAVATISNATGADGLANTVATGNSAITAALSGITSPSAALSVTAATLVSIQVTPATVNLALGTRQKLAATGVYSDNSAQDVTTLVTWSSSDTTVGAAANSGSEIPAGELQTFGVGSAQITAIYPSSTVSGSAALNVTPATLVSLAIQPHSSQIASGTTQQFFATGRFTDLSTQDLTSSVTWVSDNTDSVSISNFPGNGLATAYTPGTVNIGASLGAVSAPAVQLVVTAATLVSIQVTAPSPSLALGTSETLTATGTFSNGSTQVLTTQVNWASTNAAAASISSDGLVGSVAVGGTQLSASFSGVTSNALALNVTDATLVSIAVTPGSPTVAPGKTQQFIATGTYSDNSTQNITSAVTWISSATTVATVSNAAASNGVATTLALGSTQISAALGAISGHAAFTVAAPPKHAYVLNGNTSGLAVYAVNASTGRLTVTSGAGTGNNPSAIAFGGSSGQFAYVVNGGNQSIEQYSVNATTGALTNVAVFTTGSSNPSAYFFAIAIDPSGRFAYVPSYLDGVVYEFSIDGTTGALKAMSPAMVAAGAFPCYAAIDPSGGFAYVSNCIDFTSPGSISQFTINQTTGALSPLSPASVSTGVNPTQLRFDPSGNYAYVNNVDNNGTQSVETISQYSFNKGTGVLTPMNPATVTVGAAGTYATSVAINPAGSSVYASLSTGGIAQYAINGSDGSLSPVSTTTSDALGFLGFTLDPSGQFAFGTDNNGSGSILQFSINASTGAIKPNNPASISTSNTNQGSLVIH